jgi:hypothetical protein
VISRDELVNAIIAEAKLADEPPEKLLEFAERIADRLRLETEPPIDATEPSIPAGVRHFDLRIEQDYLYPHGKRKARIRGGKAVRRDPKTITHLVVHQTAVEYGLSERQVRASSGDRELALARRFLEVACHVAACRSGFYVLTHPLEDFLYHGNGFNKFSIGLEIDGRYAGLEDDPSTVAREDLRTTWRGEPTVLTPKTVRAAQAAIAHVVVEGRKLEMPLHTIVAHRQSSGTRRSDPGQAIWQRVVLPIAEELHLNVDTDAVLTSTNSGRGRSVPLIWDPNGVGDY